MTHTNDKEAQEVRHVDTQRMDFLERGAYLINGGPGAWGVSSHAIEDHSFAARTLRDAVDLAIGELRKREEADELETRRGVAVNMFAVLRELRKEANELETRRQIAINMCAALREIERAKDITDCFEVFKQHGLVVKLDSQA